MSEDRQRQDDGEMDMKRSRGQDISAGVSEAAEKKETKKFRARGAPE